MFFMMRSMNGFKATCWCKSYPSCSAVTILSTSLVTASSVWNRMVATASRTRFWCLVRGSSSHLRDLLLSPRKGQHCKLHRMVRRVSVHIARWIRSFLSAKCIGRRHRVFRPCLTVSTGTSFGVLLSKAGHNASRMCFVDLHRWTWLREDVIIEDSFWEEEEVDEALLLDSEAF